MDKNAPPPNQARTETVLEPVDPVGETAPAPASLEPGAPLAVEPGARLGRYEIVGRLGAGGMGVVFEARDTELDRIVALKLVSPSIGDLATAQDRLRREAQAMARLSHPNVATVFDIGAIDDRLFIAMELVRGGTLRDHVSQRRPWRDELRTLIDAGRGLAAAHEAGVIHRDFKPDNVLVRADGTVRVADFGLAREVADPADLTAAAAPTQTAGVGGTLAYMAPESFDGAASAATDQFAFAVTVFEVLEGHRPFESRGSIEAHLRELGEGRRRPWRRRELPARVRAAVDRGLAIGPADRWPSMSALCDVLEPRRSRVLAWALVPALVAAAAGIAVVASRSTSPDEKCSGGAVALAPVWTAERALAGATRIERIGTAFATAVAPRVREQARRLGEDWISAHHAGCTAHERGELSDELYDRATVCLARSRAGLAATMQLLETEDAAQLDKVIAALAVAGGAAQCTDPIMLAAEAGSLATEELREIDQQIEAAAVHARAATSRAVALAEQAAAAARASGDPRLLARALLVVGHAHMSGELSRAVAPLDEAMKLALANGQDELTTEAYARRAYVRARTPGGDPRLVLDGLELAEVIGRRSREHGAFARALLANNVGSVAALVGDFARARDGFRRASTEAKAVRGPGAVELMVVVTNLAMFTADRAERARLFAEASAGITAVVGPDHPDALSKQLQAITDQEDGRAVATELAALCPRMARLHPTNAWQIDTCAFELAWQAIAIGEPARALEAARLARPGQRGIVQRLLEAHGRLAEDRPTRAAVGELERLADAEASKIERLGWYQSVLTADTELALAAAARAAGDHARAIRAATRAFDHLERVSATIGVPAGYVERRLAWARELRVSGQ